MKKLFFILGFLCLVCRLSAQTTISYSFLNSKHSAEMVNGTEVRYFEFDVAIHANSSNIFTDLLNFKIQYGGAAFGKEVVTNQRVEVTPVGGFSNADVFEKADASTAFYNRFSLGFDNTYHQGPEQQIPISGAEPTLIAHIKMQLQDCGKSTNLSFLVPEANYSRFAELRNTTGVPEYWHIQEGYDYSLNYDYELNTTTCEIIADPIASTKFTPGNDAGNILVITGKNFGAVREKDGIGRKGEIKFINADKADEHLSKLNDIDYLSWSDTEIRVKIPSFIEYVENQNTINRTPGSGKFKILNYMGDEVESPNPVDIAYSVINQPVYDANDNITRKVRVHHANVGEEQSGDMYFILGDQMAQNADAVACIKKALGDWSCVLPVNLYLKVDENGNPITVANYDYHTSDQINVIYFNAAHVDPTAVMTAYSTRRGCNVGGIYQSFVHDADIAATPTPTYKDVNGNPQPAQYFYDLTGAGVPSGHYDFYAVFMHEVGHALGLAHLVDENALMHYQTQIGPISGSNRITLNTGIPFNGSSTAIAGTQDVLQASAQVSWSGCENVGTLSTTATNVCGGSVAAGATFENPIEAGILLFNSSYSNEQNNTPDNEFGNTYTGPNNQTSDDIFYKFTIQERAQVTISTCGSGLANTYLHLLDGSHAHLQSNNDSGACSSAQQSSITTTLAPGNYFAVAEGYGAASGAIQMKLEVEQVPLPVGATLERPIVAGSIVTSSSFHGTYNNEPANGYGNFYNKVNNQASDDIFIKFTLEENLILYAEASMAGGGSSYFHVLDNSGNHLITSSEIYSGTNEPYMRERLMAGTYYLVVEGLGSGSGEISVQLSSDKYTGESFDKPYFPQRLSAGQQISMEVITATPLFRFGNNYSGPNNQASDDVFFKVTYDEEVLAYFNLCYSELSDTYLHLLDANKNYIQSNDNSSHCYNANKSYLEKVLKAGTYYVVIEGKGNTNGKMKLFIGSKKSGGSEDAPIDLGTLGLGTQVSTRSNDPANNFGNTYTGTGNQASDDIFYKFKLSAQGQVDISLCGSGISDSYLHLLDVNGNRIAYNDDNSNCSNRYHSFLSKNLAQGTYYVVVEGFGSSTGSITTAISFIRLGANLAHPISIPTLNIGSSYQKVQSNESFHNFGNYYTGTGNQPSHDIFYKLILNSKGILEASLCGSGISDSYMHLLDVNGNRIAYNDDNSNCSNRYHSFLSEVLEKGTYYLVVEGYSGYSGSITTNVTLKEYSYPILWKDQVNTSSSGNTLTKTNSNYWWNAGAASSNYIPAYEDGWVQMKVNSTSTNVMFGLSYSNDSYTWNTIDFNCYLKQGSIWIYQRGTFVASDVSTYSVGDEIRLQRKGSNIEIVKNGSIIYTLSSDRSKSLRADVSLYTPNSQIANAYSSHPAAGDQGGPIILASSTEADNSTDSSKPKKVRKHGNDAHLQDSVKTEGKIAFNFENGLPNKNESNKILVVDEDIWGSGGKTFTTSPNPTTGKLEIQFISKKEVNATLKIINAQGIVLLIEEWYLKEGHNSIVMDISEYSSGTYHVQIGYEGRTESTTVIKL